MADETGSKTDILIIGSGIGGLSAGIILSKLGYSVAIIEKNRLAGGLMRSYTRRGYDCPVGIHYLGALDSGQPLRRMFDYLGVTGLIPLERMGGEGIIDRFVFDDFTFDLPEGLPAFEDNLRAAFPSEQPLIDGLMDNMKAVADRFHALDFLYAPFNLLSLADYLEPLGKYLTEHDCSAKLRAVLGVPPSWIGLTLTECPVLYHHMALASYLFSAWRLKDTGARMADAFASRFAGLGGRLVLNDAADHLLMEDRSVKGVVLKSGRVLRSETLISAIHPKILSGMIPEPSLKPSYRRRVMELEDTYGLFSAAFAVDADDSQLLPYNIFRVYTDAAGDIPGGVFFQLKKGGTEGRKMLCIIQPDHAGAWRDWQSTATGGRGESYLAKKREKAGLLLGEAEKIFGSFRRADYLDAYTPLTIRDWVNSPDGSAYGIRRSTKQLLRTASLARANIKGLYFAGQNALLPGIVGTVSGSFYAVKQIIGDDRFRKDVAL